MVRVSGEAAFPRRRLFTALSHHLERLAEASVLFFFVGGLLLFGPVERALHHLAFQVWGLTLEPDSLKICFEMLGSFQRVKGLKTQNE